MKHSGRRTTKYLYAPIWENYHVRRPPGIWCLVFWKVAQKILKRAETQKIVERSDNWEIPTFLCRVFHLICSCHGYIRTVNEQTAADILCAVKRWMLTVRHNKHITVHINFFAPHITTNFCPAVLCTYFLPRKPCASADPSQHLINIAVFTFDDAQTMTSCDTDRI